MNKKKILFCHSGLASFVKTDLNILSSRFEVTTIQYSPDKNKMKKMKNIFSSFFFALKHVPQCHVVFVWFGGFHGFFPILLAKLLNKKSIIVVAGYDAVCIPSIQFGIFYRKNLLQWCTRKIYHWVDLILPVDDSLVLSTNQYMDTTQNDDKIGLKHYMPDLKTTCLEVPFGYDKNTFYRPNNIKKIDQILTVGLVDDEQTFYRKGFDLFIKAANLLPHLSFTMVGMDKAFLKKMKLNIPKNLTIHDKLSQENLILQYACHKVFLQLSLSEGLPNTLCEAMLCECIPIGSAVNGIPKAIGDTGFILQEKDEDKLVYYIEEALQLDESHGVKARERIIQMFPLEKRAMSLISLVDGC